LNRSIEREVLPKCQKYGMGAMVWSPLAMGMLTGRYRKGQQTDSARMKFNPAYMTDYGKLDAVEQLILVAQEAGLSLTHMAMAFAIAHPGVTAANLGPRTMEQLEDLLAGAGVVLSDEVLDKIDKIVPPGTDVGPLHAAYNPPAITQLALRRRSTTQRVAA
jgi:aryl-alcohol dehydrogenase-like predicted oxidoreductase